MAEDEEKKEETGRTRRKPEIQIYRPGMMRRGIDVTAGAVPPPSSKPPDPGKRPSKLLVSSPSRNKVSPSCVDQRRRSNDTDSNHSYRGDSGSTTPDAVSLCGDRRNSGGRPARTFVRGGKRDRYDDNRSERSTFSVRSDAAGGYYDRSGYSSRQSSRDDVRNDRQYIQGQQHQYHYRERDDRRAANGGKPYDSTQSLFNSRYPGGYLVSGNSNHSNDSPRRRDNDRPPFHGGSNRFQRAGTAGNERSSMRAEAGQRRQRGGRKRNDSINSTQSEIPISNVQPLSVDVDFETQSQAAAAPSSSSLSIFDLGDSYESFAAFNWSEEMENETTFEREREERERQQNEELQKRLEACANGDKEDDSERLASGIVRINIGSSHSPSGPRNSTVIHVPSRNGRRENHRQRRDSDRSSSFGGSIAEEQEENVDEDEEVEASGERTPTRDRSCDRLSERRSSDDQPQVRGRGRALVYSRTDLDERPRTVIQPGSRLAGRVEFGSRGSLNGAGDRERKRGPAVYMPPAIRKAEAVSSAPANRVSPESMIRQDDTTCQQISRNEGPKIDKINAKILSAVQRVSQRRDLAAAAQMVQLSEQLSEIYFELLVRDIAFTFSKNLEQHLWKQAFHKCIDTLRSAANSTRDSAREMRGKLIELVNNGITFYGRLLDQYEAKFDISLESTLTWPLGLPPDDFASLLSTPAKTPKLPQQQLAIKSLSRHLVALGDLHRYKTLVDGSENYSVARSWYLRAAQLWPSSGHSYNQLAVVAYFSMLYTSARRARLTPIEILSNRRQERVLDEIFFYVRALSARHPFEGAGERLRARLAAMKKKVDKYQDLLDHEQQKSDENSSEQPTELWIRDNATTSTAEPSGPSTSSSAGTNPSQLHRRTVSYLIHVAGMLLTKIDMEKFESVFNRAFCQLNDLLAMPEAPMSAQQLIQLLVIFLYVVCAAKKKEAEDSPHLNLVYRTLVTFMASLLQPLCSADLEELRLSKTASRVLPALSILSRWLQSDRGDDIRKANSQPLELRRVVTNPWHSFAMIGSKLADLNKEQRLGTVSTSEAVSYMPELVYLASFLDVFQPGEVSCDIVVKNEDSVLEAAIVRLRIVLRAFEQLVKDSEKFQYIEEEQAFRYMNKTESYDDSIEEMGDSERILSRKELLEREQLKNKTFLVIKPTQLVLDTNVLLDYLDLVEKILASDRFQIILPTIVVQEINGLSQEPKSSAHSERAGEDAKKVLTWLKSHVKCPRMSTLTTHGKKLTFSLLNEDVSDSSGMINDDFILRSCTTYVKSHPPPPIVSSSIPSCSSASPVFCNLVLLSGDRGICIKAASLRIPSRSITDFCQWAELVSR